MAKTARRVPRGGRAAVGVLSVFVGLLVAPVALAGQSVPAGAAAIQYVALGDSYASGPFIPSQVSSASGCLRSTSNYPHLVAAAFGLALTDVTCSGATTADLSGSETTSNGPVPPQLNALRPSTGLVTVTVGGDDLGFVNIVKSCLAATPWGPTPSGRTCKARYDAGGVDQLGAIIAALQPKLDATLTAIHLRSPAAQVFVVGYPDIIATNGSGCWPSLPFTRTDAPYLGNVETELNTMVASVAAANGATYVDTYTPSESDSACSARSVRWVEPIVPTAPAAPLHPDATGESGMARVVEASIAAHWT
jgi:GDSL-like Lipase/Acylhydrolase family